MSLADTLTAIFIFTIITTLLIGIYFTYANVFRVQIAYNELNSATTLAFNKMAKNIRSATNIVDNATINSTSYSTDSDTLVLELPSIDSNQNIISSTYDYLAIQQDPADSTLLKSDLEPDASSSRIGGKQLIVNDTSLVIFNYNDTNLADVDKVEIILKTSKTAGKKTVQAIMQSTIELRNK